MLWYGELVGILGFLVELLLILGTNRLLHHPPEWKRGIGGALIAGVYCAACLAPGLSFLQNDLWSMVFRVLPGSVAFGWSRKGVRRLTVFLLLRFALSGVAVAAGGGPGGLLLALGVVGIMVVRLVSVPASGGDLIPVELRYEDKVLRTTALRDTGNQLRDPLTGETVLVAGADMGERLFGLSTQQLSDPVKTLAAGLVPGMRLVPYSTIGQKGAMLLAIRLKNVKIGSWQGDPLVAFAPQRFGNDVGYEMLVGGAV